MPASPTDTLRINALIAAFAADGYSVDSGTDVLVSNGRIGVRATHNTATIGNTGKKKKTYFIEGDPHTVGYLLGRLAEPEIARMCTEFVPNIVFDYINANIPDGPIRKALGKVLADVMYVMSWAAWGDVPDEFKAEVEGLLDGCREANPHTKVSREALWTLNVGVDAILTFVYTGKLPLARLPHFLKLRVLEKACLAQRRLQVL